MFSFGHLAVEVWHVRAIELELHPNPKSGTRDGSAGSVKKRESGSGSARRRRYRVKRITHSKTLCTTCEKEGKVTGGEEGRPGRRARAR